MRRVIVIAAAGLAAALVAAPASAWMINKDIEQRLVTAQSNFETELQGNATTGLTGGTSSVTNPFANGVRTQSFDGSKTTVSWSGSNSIGQSFGVKRHFGIFGAGTNPPKVLAEYWTPASNNTTGRVPGVSSDVTYAVGTGMATGMISNDTPDEITINAIGYRVENRHNLQLEDLNATSMPPGSFTSIALGDPVLSSGEASPSFNTASVTPDQCIVLYIDASFSGVSSGNAYDGSTREWVASRINPAGVPGIGVPGLVLITIVLAAAGAWLMIRRRESFA